MDDALDLLKKLEKLLIEQNETIDEQDKRMATISRVTAGILKRVQKLEEGRA